MSQLSTALGSHVNVATERKFSEGPSKNTDMESFILHNLLDTPRGVGQMPVSLKEITSGTGLLDNSLTDELSKISGLKKQHNLTIRDLGLLFSRNVAG